MPIMRVTVEYNVYRGENPEEVKQAAIDYAQNLLFEHAMARNVPMPTQINIGVDAAIGHIDAWYEYDEDRNIVFMCPECDEQLVGHNKDQIRDLLAKHYEITHNKEQDNG